MTLYDWMEEEPLRLRVVEVSPEWLLEMIKVGDGVVIDGERIDFDPTGDSIPNTAKALGAGISSNGNIKLMIEDETFDPVAIGALIAPLNIKYRSSKEMDE